MKSATFLFLILYSYISTVYSQKAASSFTLKGTIADRTERVITLSYKNAMGKRITHTARVYKGKFTFKGFLSSPVEADLLGDRAPKSDNDSQYALLFLFPGEMTISIPKIGFDHAVVTGSPMQNDWLEFQKQREAVLKIKDSLYTQLFKLERAGNTPQNHKAHVLIAGEIERHNLQDNQIEYRFIETHPASYFSADLLRESFAGRVLSLDTAMRFYNALTPAVKKSMDGQAIAAEIARRSAAATGSYAPNFIKTDIHGRKFELKAFKNKNYVLLYFWGSWSFYQGKDTTPVKLKQWYQKYHSKGLEVVGISRNILKRDWKKAIATDHMGMFHQIFSPYDNLFDVYDINSTPPVFLFLIDKNGKIIGRYLGEHVDWQTGTDNEGSLADLDDQLAKTFAN